MRIISNYRDNDNLRESFNNLSRKVFRIDFEELYNKGFWGDDFECHSMLLDNTLIANVSVIKHSMVIEGRKSKSLQFCTVMTDPAYTGNGYIRALMEHVINTYTNEYEYMYLYANDDVTGLYTKFGFMKFPQALLHIEGIEQCDEQFSLVKLDMNSSKDFNLLKHIISNRIINSYEYSIEGADTAIFWNCLNTHREHIYYNETHQIIVICETGTRLQVYDVFRTSDISIHSILCSMPAITGREAILHFNAEQAGETYKILVNQDDDNLMMRPEFNSGIPVVFSSMAHA